MAKWKRITMQSFQLESHSHEAGLLSTAQKEPGSAAASVIPAFGLLNMPTSWPRRFAGSSVASFSLARLNVISHLQFPESASTVKAFRPPRAVCERDRLAGTRRYRLADYRDRCLWKGAGCRSVAPVVRCEALAAACAAPLRANMDETDLLVRDERDWRLSYSLVL